jgi:hypothetical protein
VTEQWIVLRRGRQRLIDDPIAAELAVDGDRRFSAGSNRLNNRRWTADRFTSREYSGNRRANAVRRRGWFLAL